VTEFKDRLVPQHLSTKIMFVKNNNNIPRKLHWYEEIACWIGAILILPFALPIILVFLISGIGLYFYDKWNDGLNN
jgi:hypothetical protein